MIYLMSNNSVFIPIGQSVGKEKKGVNVKGISLLVLDVYSVPQFGQDA